jgi:hypothetical protein
MGSELEQIPRKSDKQAERMCRREAREKFSIIEYLNPRTFVSHLE